MSSWNFSTSTSAFSAKDVASNTISGRTGTRVSDNSAITELTSLASQTSLVGMNVEAIPGMRQEIQNYCSAIERKLEEIETEINPDVAFKSEEVQSAIKSYLTKVKEYCINLTSDLLAFSDKLADARNEWIKQTQEMAGDINSATGAFDAGTKYTESVQ